MGLLNFFKKKEKTYICARCKKEITNEESNLIGSHRFCSDCAFPPENVTIASKETSDTEPEDMTAEIRADSNISNPATSEKNDLSHLENMFSVESIWSRKKQYIVESLEKNLYIEFDFLKETVEVASDGYGGTDKLFYFENGIFYTQLSHWDGGNMFANRSYAHTRITKAVFARQLDKKKSEILHTLPKEDKIKFEQIYNDIQALLLSQF